MEEKIKGMEAVKLYVSTIYNRTKQLINAYWLKFCRKFKIFKFKSFTKPEQVVNYLNSKGFKYKYKYKYQKSNAGHSFFFSIKDKIKLGNAFNKIEELNEYQLDYFHHAMICLYLSYILDNKYKKKIKERVKGVPTNSVFYVNRVQTKDGTYNVSCHKNGRGGFNVVQWEKA